MKTLLALLLALAACGDSSAPTTPSADCWPEKNAVHAARGAPDSIAFNSGQVADHPTSYYERWYYRGSPFVETFAWGALLPHCIYDQENRPEWDGL